MSTIFDAIRRCLSSGRATLKGWSDDRISDDWFRSHFIYASDVVAQQIHRWCHTGKPAVLDFGCGDGIMALGMRLRHSIPNVCGVDLHDSHQYLLDTASKQLGLRQLPAGLDFKIINPDHPFTASLNQQYDFIYSWSVFEHVPTDQLIGILQGMKQSLRPNGFVFIQIEPLYYSPFGSHLGGVVSEPWAHLTLSEDDLKSRVFGFDLSHLEDEFKNKTFDVCSDYDFKAYLFREYSSLNKLTWRRLVDLCLSAGFRVEDCWRSRCDHIPSATLLERYPEEDLTTAELRLVLR